MDSNTQGPFWRNLYNISPQTKHYLRGFSGRPKRTWKMAYAKSFWGVNTHALVLSESDEVLTSEWRQRGNIESLLFSPGLNTSCSLNLFIFCTLNIGIMFHTCKSFLLQKTLILITQNRISFWIRNNSFNDKIKIFMGQNDIPLKFCAQFAENSERNPHTRGLSSKSVLQKINGTTHLLVQN